MKKNPNEADKTLLDVLYQACCREPEIIDNQCISAYEKACEYLTRKGYLKKVNSRTYKLLEKAKWN